MTLRVSDQLCLPPDAVTRRMAILAMSGAGKSNAAVVVAEQMHDTGMQWVAIDPKGDWWGVRADGSGDGPGIAVPVLGGLHGDIPLEAHSGKLVADLVVDERLSCVLDVSEFDTQQQMWGFLADFGAQLYRRKADARSPMHLFLDEADQYVPQSTREGGMLPRCLGVWLRVATKGRQRGIGTTLISQRSATVHKDALYMAEALFAMRTVGPKNRGDRPVIAGWFDEHALDGMSIVDLLPTLADGEAIVSSPVWLGIGQQRIKFARRRTYDSGSTPTVEDASPVAALAAIDIDTLRSRLAETIERSKADDPAALRSEIARLQRELANNAAGDAAAGLSQRLLDEVREDRDLLRRIVDGYARIHGNLIEMLEDAATGLSGTAADVRTAIAEANQRATGATILNFPERASVVEQADTSVPKTDAARRAGSTPAGGTSSDASLAKAQRAVLTVLAQYPHGRSMGQIALLAGYRQSGGFRNTLSALRTAGYIEGSNGEVMRITASGRDILGSFEEMPSGRALLDMWLADPRLGKGHRAVLAYAADRYPDEVTGEQAARETGYEYSGGFRNILSWLRTAELIEGSNAAFHASPLFFELGER